MNAADFKRYALLGELSESDLDLLAGLVDAMELESGEPLFQEGHEADGLVLVDSGELRLESARAGCLGSVGAGATLGALSLVAVGRREVTAIATEPTRVMILPREAFLRFVDDAPRAGCRLLLAVLGEIATGLRPSLDRLATPSDGSA